MSSLRYAAIALAGVAVVLGILVMFLPFASFSTAFFGATADSDAYAWRATFHAEFGGDSSSDSKAWTDNDFDDEDGIGMVRTAGPLLALSTVLVLVGLVLALRTATIGGVLAIVSAVVGGLGVFLLATGIKELFDDQQEWAVGFWLAIAAAVLSAVAGVLGLLAPRGQAV